MVVPILCFAAAGALLGAGTGGAKLLWAKGRRDAAAHEFAETANLHEEALRAQMRVETVREEARARGMDPDEVIRGVDALVNGQLSATDVSRALQI